MSRKGFANGRTPTRSNGLGIRLFEASNLFFNIGPTVAQDRSFLAGVAERMHAPRGAEVQWKCVGILHSNIRR